jgi:hypothetical protein
MRQRRDPFARVTYVPNPADAPGQKCVWCGGTRTIHGKARVWSITLESDSGRRTPLDGVYCTWLCAEAYHNDPIGR